MDLMGTRNAWAIGPFFFFRWASNPRLPMSSREKASKKLPFEPKLAIDRKVHLGGEIEGPISLIQSGEEKPPEN